MSNQLTCSDVKSVYRANQCCASDSGKVVEQCKDVQFGNLHTDSVHIDGFDMQNLLTAKKLDGCEYSPWKTCTKGVVSCASQIGADCGTMVMQQGGNAFDAMAATQFCMGVTEPQSSGIGGGLFAVGKKVDGQTFALDGREEAPGQFPEDALYQRSWFARSLDTQAVGVPGTLAAMARLVADHGKTNLTFVMQPAIKLLEEGMVITPRHISTFHIYDEDGNIADPDVLYPYYRLSVPNDTETLTLFGCHSGTFKWTRPPTGGTSDPNWSGGSHPGQPNFGTRKDGAGICEGGRPWKVGDRFYNPKLLHVYRKIAELGASYFYTGEFASALVQKLTDPSMITKHTREDVVLSKMTLADLGGYKAVYRKPISRSYKENKMTFMNMPTSGGLSSSMLAALVEMTAPHGSDYKDPQYVRAVYNAMKAVYADRNKFMADADWVDVPIEGLENVEYLKARVAQYLNTTRGVDSVPAGCPPGFDCENMVAVDGVEGVSTTNIVAIDCEGNVAVATTTLEQAWGNGITVNGVMLNNELTDFNSDLSSQNRAQGGKKLRRTALPPDDITYGGKRPRSSMSPTIIEKPDGTVIGLGSAGGSRIFFTNMWTAFQMLDANKCPYEALYPRFLTRGGTADLAASADWPSPQDEFNLNAINIKTNKRTGYDPARGVIEQPYMSKVSIGMMTPEHMVSGSADHGLSDPAETYLTTDTVGVSS